MSEASWDTMSGRESNSINKVRITVNFASGRSLLIPIFPSASVSELKNEALRRAQTSGFQIPAGELVIRVASQDGAELFGDDPLEDILDDTGKVFWIGKPQLTQSTSARSQTSTVHVRWITLGRALSYPTLEAIPADPDSINSSITLRELEGIASHRLYSSPGANEALAMPNSKLELFLSQCPLSSTDLSMSFDDLDVAGTLEKPLNIFVVPRKDCEENEDTPHSIWGFESSDRGIATFSTCLNVLMREVHCKPSVFRRLLKLLFQITHFPPAIEALHLLAVHNRLIPKPMLILATCFRELALRMVPGSLVADNVRSVLEGSRQIFAWFYDMGDSMPEESDNLQCALVRTVKFVEVKQDTIEYSAAPDEKVEIIEFLAAGEAMSDTAPQESVEPATPETVTMRKVRVMVDVSCRANLRQLALSLWGRYDYMNNYYVDFRDNIQHPISHRRIPLTDAADFDSLMLAANRSERFLMLSPLELIDRTSQGITLSKDGYVSLYSLRIGHSMLKASPYRPDDFRSLLENAITGRERLTGSNPAQALYEALQPVIQQRKSEGTWDIDSWELRNETAAPVDASSREAVVICFDLSISMSATLGNSWMGTNGENTLSRLDETKQVFRNFIARIVAYDLVNTYVGLVTFATEAKVATELSRVRSDFKTRLENVEADGCTALWDGIKTAHDMLIRFKTENPTTRLRIIALTDGEDNHSEIKPAALCKLLYDENIVLDSLVIGYNACTLDLFRMSKHTGGYAFNPTSRLLLFQTFLLEPFLDISARPDIVRVPLPDNYDTSTPKEADMKTMYDFPPCRPHELQAGYFISLTEASRFFSVRRSSSLLSLSQTTMQRGRTPSYRVPSGLSSGRIFLEEMRFMISHPHNSIDVYVNETNMSFWKIVMAGPTSSPYENGTFVLFVDMPPDYPQSPPTVRFITPILHPNITKHGRICHQILSDNWRASFHIYNVLQNIFGLLTSPEASDAVDELATLKFWTDSATANSEIRTYVDRFARKTRGEWRSEIEARERHIAIPGETA